MTKTSSSLSSWQSFRGFLQNLRFMLRGEKARVRAVIFASLLQTLAEVLAVAVIAPFCLALVNGSFSLFGVEFGTRNDATVRNLLSLGAVLVALYTLRTVICIWTAWKQAGLFEIIRQRTLTTLAGKYLRADLEFHLQNRSSNLVNDILHVTDVATGSVISSSIRLFTDALISLALIAAIIFQDWRAFFVMMAVMGIFVFLVIRFVRPIVAKTGVRTMASYQSIMRTAQNAFGSMRETKVFGGTEVFLEKLSVAASERGKTSQTFATAQAVPRPVFELGMITFLVLSLFIAMFFQMHNAGQVIATIGTIGAAGMRLIPCISAMMTSLSAIYTNRNYLAKLVNTLKQIKSASATSLEHAEQVNFQSLEISALNFSYPNSMEPALRDVHLRIERNDILGVVGKSGAGKSTLADALLGLLSTKMEGVLLNGKALDSLNSQSYRDMFAYIPQSTFVLDGSLRENVAFGMNPAEVSDAEVWEALKLAQLTEVAKSLPHGLDSELGDRGIRLSGGQRQRLAIARALFHKRQIIVMDEATSALDSETESEVVAAIDSLQGRMTMIIIAHRTSTLKHANRILVLENGLGHVTDAATWMQQHG